MTFLSVYFPFRKVQFHLSALMYMYVSMATMQLFGLLLKTRISFVFQAFPPERNFLWDSLLCFGHPNILRSLITAQQRTVTIETFQKSFCPNMVIYTKTTDKRHVSQYIMISLRPRNHLGCFFFLLFFTIFLAHSSILSLVIAPAPTVMALAIPASN